MRRPVAVNDRIKRPTLAEVVLELHGGFLKGHLRFAAVWSAFRAE